MEEKKRFGKDNRNDNRFKRTDSNDRRGAGPDRGARTEGKRDSSNSPQGKASDFNQQRKTSDAYGSSPDKRGKPFEQRGASYGRRDAAPDRQGSANKQRGEFGQRDRKYDNRQDSDRTDAPSFNRGASPERGPSSENRGSSFERKSMYNSRGNDGAKRNSSYNRSNPGANRNASFDRDHAPNKNESFERPVPEKRQNPPVEAEHVEAQGFQEDVDKLEGRNSVIEALKSGRSINRIFVAKGDREGSVNQILAMAREKHILIQEIDRSKLDAMSQTQAHQGVIALVAAKDYVEVEDILKIAADSGKPPFIIILDEITDAYNLGSILRTANAAGVHGVIIPKRRAVGLTMAVSKASAGAIEYVPVARVTNIVQTIESLKKQNIWVVGTDATGDKAYFDRDLTGAIALVIGSEGEGMGKLVRESCDFIVNIPMSGQITSLNAAVAGAVVTFEILRQRSKKNP